MCAPGTSNELEAQELCTVCTTGKVSTKYGQTTCTPCPFGTTPNENYSQCIMSSGSIVVAFALALLIATAFFYLKYYKLCI